MNKSVFHFNYASAAAIFISAAAFSGTIHASGYAIIENSASGMGQAFAGAAAVAEDPSTIYFNPAGMMYLDGTQATMGMHIVDSNADFNDKGSTNLAYAGVPQGGDGGNAGDVFFIPNFYYVQDFAEKYKFGLGINAPFGLGTEYSDGWKGRYTSTKSELKAININPSVAFRANEKLAVGIGMNIQYMDVTLKKDIYQAALGHSDGRAKVSGDSWGIGVNLGFIYELTEQTRLGMHFRSTISHTIDGNARFKNLSPYIAGLPNLARQDAEAELDTPSTFSISMTHQLNDRLTLLGDVTYTTWSNFDELRVKGDNGAIVTLVEQNWDDVYRVALGMKYQYSDRWIFRTGIAHDETPIDDDYRTSRIPGDDRLWLSFGASYTVSDNLTIDAGYSHLWVEDAKIDEEYKLLTGSGTLKGEYDSDVNILSVQATWKF